MPWWLRKGNWWLSGGEGNGWQWRISDSQSRWIYIPSAFRSSVLQIVGEEQESAVVVTCLGLPRDICLASVANMTLDLEGLWSDPEGISLCSNHPPFPHSWCRKIVEEPISGFYSHFLVLDLKIMGVSSPSFLLCLIRLLPCNSVFLFPWKYGLIYHAQSACG